MLFTMYDLRAIKTNKGIVLLALTGPDPEKIGAFSQMSIWVSAPRKFYSTSEIVPAG